MITDLRTEDPSSVGPYRLLGRLGAGGMGQVYLGKSPGGRLVAIKLIRPELADERGFRARFASEISAAKNVSGIYTAAVVDADAETELPWMATVYVPGPSLTDAVEEDGPLPVTSVIALAGGLAEALAAIHRVGLVHRDLKPSNVLLATDGPRVIDFGISLALERSMMTATGMVMGSPGFMSPEQARGRREVGPPTDVFSLGAVLAYAATANNPFGGGPTPALLYRVVNEPPDLTGVPARLSPLIQRCLAKDPAERPTPGEILELLGDDVGVLSGEWLPASITQTMNRYSPTLQTPLPPALREPDAPQAEPSPGPPTPVPTSPAVGSPVPAGWEPTALAPSIPAPAASATVPATVVDQGSLAQTSVVSMPGGATTAGRGVPGGTGGPPYPGPPSPLRRWRWPILAAAAAVIIAVVAVLLVSHSNGGTPTVNPTSSLAGNATKAPKTPAATPTATSTPTPTQRTAQPASNPATQTAPTTAPAQTASPTTSAPTATATPTQTTSSSPTATLPTSTTSPTQSATPTQSPTQAGTPTANSTQAGQASTAATP